MTRGDHGRIFIVGAARSGTSFFAGTLAKHPAINAGAVKEPNYFSRSWGRGPKWYDALYQGQSNGFRLDASVSYTFPQYPEALTRIADTFPDAHIVYIVREPVGRAVSHYQLMRHYFQREQGRSFGEAIDRDELYLSTSDYAHWIGRFRAFFSTDQVLVLPFSRVTADVVGTANVVLGHLGMNELAPSAAAPSHRNNVRTFRHPAWRVARRAVRRSRFYPRLRRGLGAERLRTLRQLLTKDVELPTVAQELGTCSQAQREQIGGLAETAGATVIEWLRAQDNRLGTSWAADWETHVSAVSESAGPEDQG